MKYNASTTSIIHFPRGLVNCAIFVLKIKKGDCIMTKKDDKQLKRVAIYIRVSSDKQAKTGDSMREQLESLEDYINKNEYMVKHSVYVDDGISGQKLERDDFTRLMQDVKLGQVDLIIFTRIDRWFRSLRHYLNTQATLEKNNVYWTAIHQPFFDTTSAHGRAFVAQSMTWAELEAQQDSERILAVFDNKVKNGEVISGTVPLGYKIENKHLVPDEETAPVILRLFQEYAKNPNVAEVSELIRNEYGIIRVNGTFSKILRRKIYIGEYRDNKNYCKPIISKELFDIVQISVSKNVRANKKYEYVFSGLIICACCKNRMAAHQLYLRTKKRKDGTFYNYTRSGYRCNHHWDSLKLCPNQKIYYERVIERELLEQLHTNIKNHVAEYEIQTAPIVNNVKKRNLIMNKIEKLKELFLNELITLDEYKNDKAKLEDQLGSIADVPIIVKDLTYVKKLLEQDVQAMYATFTIAEKQRFWRSFVDYITLDNHRNIGIVFL